MNQGCDSESAGVGDGSSPIRVTVVPAVLHFEAPPIHVEVTRPQVLNMQGFAYGGSSSRAILSSVAVSASPAEVRISGEVIPRSDAANTHQPPLVGIARWLPVFRWLCTGQQREIAECCIADLRRDIRAMAGEGLSPYAIEAIVFFRTVGCIGSIAYDAVLAQLRKLLPFLRALRPGK